MLRVLMFLCLAASLLAQPAEPILAKMGVSVAAGYRSGDASSFRDHTHPSLISKIRRLMIARLGGPQSFAPVSVTTTDAVSKMSDAEVVDAFVKFIASINQFAPHLTARWSHSAGAVIIEDSHAKVAIEERVEISNSKDGAHGSKTSERLIEFQLLDGDWKYIAGPATAIHLDLPLDIL